MVWIKPQSLIHLNKLEKKGLRNFNSIWGNKNIKSLFKTFICKFFIFDLKYGFILRYSSNQDEAKDKNLELSVI